MSRGAGGDRTHGPPIMSRVLSPTELPPRIKQRCYGHGKGTIGFIDGRRVVPRRDRGIVSCPKCHLHSGEPEVLAVGLHELAQLVEVRCSSPTRSRRRLKYWVIVSGFHGSEPSAASEKRYGSARVRHRAQRPASPSSPAAPSTGPWSSDPPRRVPRSPVLRRHLLGRRRRGDDDAPRDRQPGSAQIDVAGSSQRAQLGSPQPGRRGDEDRPGVLGATRSLGRVDQRAHLFGRRARPASCSGIAGGSAHCAGFESRHPHRQAWVNIEDRQAWIWYTRARREPSPLMLAVEVGEHLRRHLAHRLRPRSA